MKNLTQQLLLVLILCPLSLQAAEGLRILLTNDDGFEAPGIRAMHEALITAGHDVYMIAPATQQSGAAASVTSGGVRITEHKDKIWAVHGRPADALRVGLGHIMKDNPPDLVVSGANFGNNTGVDTNISGTVGAAITALQLGTPAIAISVQTKFEEIEARFPSTVKAFPDAGIFLVKYISSLKKFDMNNVININYPATSKDKVLGVKWATLSKRSVLTINFNQKEDGRWSPEYNLSAPSDKKSDENTDTVLLSRGYITLTLLDGNMSVKPDRSYRKVIKSLE